MSKYKVNDPLPVELIPDLLALFRLESTGELWWRGGNEPWDHALRFYVQCNDAFVWPCSDPEPIVTQEDVDLLRQIRAQAAKIQTTEYPSDWPLLYCATKRGMRPQGAMYKYIEESMHASFDAVGPPPRAEDMLNQVPQP